MKAYAKLGIKPEERQWDIGTCQKVADDHLSEVEEGMQMLVKALEFHPDYGDAMACMNLLYRERADLHCNNVAARDADLARRIHGLMQHLPPRRPRRNTRKSHTLILTKRFDLQMARCS